mmetsp:Transcript_70853/g.163807  ORF Transcript_70853/g.163807 Transcript_70853/m.163807 type:complete len:184 (-) Transcript_70853:135-686(-)|eukprot:CAMPEP_0171092712 /NCGR_PEP_ID=MMETSP0766_2-20121228/36991_1 /TAXON_ID=439317 /ORGANISM="Gambierdiscus australes, Strain CAWD 149" /LENGTH=183 /DNA_ID=CAMNT_0011550999 /DNA_START=79 /DNA_END=630 /DNA_ORIENTATION=+
MAQSTITVSPSLLQCPLQLSVGSRTRQGQQCSIATSPLLDSALQLASAASTVRVPRFRQPWGQRTLLVCYFVAVFAGRLLLRLPCAADFNWAIVMALEDGLSLLSFVVGFLYLRHTDGAPFILLAKYTSGSREVERGRAEGAATAAATRRHTEEAMEQREAGEGQRAHGVVMQQSPRLFYFAM